MLIQKQIRFYSQHNDEHLEEQQSQMLNRTLFSTDKSCSVFWIPYSTRGAKHLRAFTSNAW